MNYKLITLMVGVGLSALTGCQSNATRENLSVSNPTIGSDIINGTVVNARGGRPGSWEHTHIVFQFDKGEPVKILEEIIDPNPYPEYPKKWLRVQVPSDVGLWAHGAYLATSSVINNSAQVTASLLNIRGGSSIVGGLPEAPGINYPILCRLPRGATVQLTGAREGDWVEILAPTNASVYVAEPYVGQRRKADRFNVENMIRQYAGWPYGELTQADYDEVTWLSFKYEEVDDPSVLAEFNLTKLNDLDLNETSVTDLSFLSGFTGLEILRLEETKISNLSPLKGLKKLERLYVTDTPNLTAKEIEKLQQALPDCKIYRYVTEHDGHQFRGPSPVIDAWVRKEPQVTPPKPTPPKEPPVPPLPEPNAIPTPHLNLPPNREPSPPPLEDSHHLVSIYDLESLAKLKNLEILELNQNQIDNLTPLAGHKNLKDLDLGYNQISDLTPLTGLKELKSLTLGENAISDLTPLSKLKGLETLHLCNYKITNLKPLANLKDLKNLNLGKNQITDLKPPWQD